MVNVTRSSMPPFEEYCAEIRELWDTRWLTNMGAKHRQLEDALKIYLDIPNISLFANGHLALENALAAFQFPAGGEVITTPFTFASTTHAIVRCGLIPVFCDIDPTTWTLDPAKVEAMITEKTVAIVPVHVYGTLCDVDSIQEIADRHGLKVIYDAAHAFGVTKNGVSAAAYGDAAVFSFHATKVFHTVEGGAVCVRDKGLAQRLTQLKNFGIRDEETVDMIGGNAKMSEFHVAMGLCNLRHLDVEIAKRKAVADWYRNRLKNTDGIRLRTVQPDIRCNYAYFPVVFDKQQYSRDEIFSRLKKKGINSRKYFYPLTSSFACYRNLPTATPVHTPVATYTAERILCLPLYSDLSVSDVDAICMTILDN